MNFNKLECFSLIGVVISILYFSKMGFISELVASEECRQLNDELDQQPIFETSEKLFIIDNDKLTRSNEIVFDNFVIKYNDYPETLINTLINRNNIYDKSAKSQQVRIIPDMWRANTTILDLCKTKKTTIQPQAAKENSRWIVVINQKDFVQSVPVEECVHKVEMQLNINTELISNAENVMCRQAESTVDLIVFINEEFLSYDFPYPSACEPYYTST